MTRKHPWLRSLGWIPILTLLLVVTAVAPAPAQTIDWDNAAGGAYSTAANWDPANVPDMVGENARFDLPETYAVTFDEGSSTTINALSLNDGDVTFRNAGAVSDATLISESVILEDVGGGGNLTLARLGGSADVNLNINNLLHINGGKTLAVLEGATVTTDSLDISIDNNNAIPEGHLLVDGTGSALTATGEIRLGVVGGTGTLTIQNGATISSPTGYIGFDSGSTGIVILNGAGSNWTASDSLYVGGGDSAAGGIGNLTLQDQGLVDVASTLKIWNAGTVTLDGGNLVTNTIDNSDGGTFDLIAGSLTMNDDLVIGAGGLLGEDRTLGFNQAVTTTGTTIVETGRLLKLEGGSLTTDDLIVNGGFHFDRGTLGLTGAVSLAEPLIVGAGGTLNVATGVDAPLATLPGSTVNIDGGPAEVNLGRGNTVFGVNLQGSLYVNDKSLRLNSSSFSQLGAYTRIDGGLLTAERGVTLSTGDNLVFASGGGTIAGKVVASAGSLIRAQGAITIGDAAALDGYVSDGVLELATANMTILDANQAVLGSLTSIGVVIPPIMVFAPGTLQADNGLILDFGKNITGYGTIDTANDPLRPTIINGYAAGYDATYPLTFTGYVKGVGTLTDIVMNGTYAPGLSTAEVGVGNLSIGDAGTLEIEIDGLTAGSQFDVVSASGDVTFDGTLAVLLDPGFTPQPGDVFTVVQYASHSGMFDTVTGTSLGDGRALIPIYDDTAFSLVASYFGDGNLDGAVDGLDYLLWASNFGDDPADDPPGSPGNGDFNDDGKVDGLDYLTWASNFGAGSATAAPEPAGFTTALLALLGLFAVSRRRIKP